MQCGLSELRSFAEVQELEQALTTLSSTGQATYTNHSIDVAKSLCHDLEGKHGQPTEDHGNGC